VSRERTDEEFVAAFKVGTEGFEILSLDTEDEGCFSWSPCDTCSSPLGGTRYDATLCNSGEDRRQVRVRVCTDCAMFSANGVLPSGG